MERPTFLVTERDRDRLLILVNHLRESAELPPHYIDDLAERVESARVIAPGDAPRSLVTMNSLVGLKDINLNEKFSCVLSYPEEADVAKRKVSVAVPLGSRMLGTRVGQVIECPAPSGQRNLRIERVYYQPEAARDFHL